MKYEYARAQVTPEQKEEIKQMAANAGLSVSDFILQKVYAGQPKDYQVLVRYLEDISSIRENMNKLLRTEITTKVIYEEEIFEMLDTIRELEEKSNKFLRKLNKTFKSDFEES